MVAILLSVILLSVAKCSRVKTPHPLRYFYIDPKQYKLAEKNTSTLGMRFTPMPVRHKQFPKTTTAYPTMFSNSIML